MRANKSPRLPLNGSLPLKVPFLSKLFLGICGRFGIPLSPFSIMAQGFAHLVLFAGLPANVLLTIGNGAPPDLFEHVPPNVTVRSFVPQADVLPHAQLLVCHGGSGTVVAGLAAGVPMVITPVFADQPDNARCLAATGLCVAITDLSVPALRDAIVQASADEDMRRRAQAAAHVIT